MPVARQLSISPTVRRSLRTGSGRPKVVTGWKRTPRGGALSHWPLLSRAMTPSQMGQLWLRERQATLADEFATPLIIAKWLHPSSSESGAEIRLHPHSRNPRRPQGNRPRIPWQRAPIWHGSAHMPEHEVIHRLDEVMQRQDGVIHRSDEVIQREDGGIGCTIWGHGEVRMSL